jgi:hypothetical protein
MSRAKTPKENGRPTKYKEEYCKMLVDHMAEGMSYESFAGFIGVNRDSLYEWDKHYVNFSDAKKIGRAKQEYANEKTLHQIAKGKLRDANVTAQIFIMKNCHKWTDRVEHEVSDSKIEINITDNESDL